VAAAAVVVETKRSGVGGKGAVTDVGPDPLGAQRDGTQKLVGSVGVVEVHSLEKRIDGGIACRTRLAAEERVADFQLGDGEEPDAGSDGFVVVEVGEVVEVQASRVAGVSKQFRAVGKIDGVVDLGGSNGIGAADERPQ